MKKEELLLVFQYGEPEKTDAAIEEFSIVSATSGELFLVERLIFAEVLNKEALHEFARTKSLYPSDKELRRLCLST